MNDQSTNVFELHTLYEVQTAIIISTIEAIPQITNSCM